MPKIIWNEMHWLRRAEDARTALGHIRNPECRAIVRRIADTYEQLAALSADFTNAARAGDPQARAGRTPPERPPVAPAQKARSG